MVVIFTGGTIAMLPDPDSGAAVPALRGAGDPGAPARSADRPTSRPSIGASCRPRTCASRRSWRSRECIARATARAEVGGVVVVQGTDVLEETAFAWDLLHDGEEPVVVVGAMRNAGDPEYDGPRNLADAIAVAADSRMRGQGVVVAMAGLVLPADDAVKTDSQAMDTFQAPNVGPLGALDRRSPRDRPLARAAPPHRRAGGPGRRQRRAAHRGRGHRREPVRAAVEHGAPGLVVEATGAGNTDPDLLAAAQEAMAKGIPVVLTTRCYSGGVEPAYGFPGGGRSWSDAGAILAGTLSGPKARVALAIGLGAGLDRDGLARLDLW